MSDLDLDIRAVSSASLGARTSAPDVNQGAGTQPVPTGAGVGTDSSTTVAASQPSFRYDSFRFIYQSDYGRVVLIDQNPETGQAVAQIPSQKALQLYAEQRRAEALAQSGVGAAVNGQGGDHAVHQATGNGQTSHNIGLITPSVSGRGVTPAPTVTDTIPSPAFIAPKATPVNITI